MGEKGSIWWPMRLIAGFMLLLPKANGYCYAQIVVFWMMTQGIGAADTLWTAALNFVEANGLYTTVSANSSTGDQTTTYSGVVEPMAAAATCSALMSAFNQVNLGTSPPLMSAIGPYQVKDGSWVVGYGTQGDVNTQATPSCGGISITALGSASASNAGTKIQNYFGTAAKTSVDAFTQAVVNQQVNNQTFYALAAADVVFLSSAATSLATTLATQAASAASTSTTSDVMTTTHLSDYGWMVAGAYYRPLMKATGSGGGGPPTVSSAFSFKTLQLSSSVVGDSTDNGVSQTTILSRTMQNLLKNDNAGNTSGGTLNGILDSFGTAYSAALSGSSSSAASGTDYGSLLKQLIAATPHQEGFGGVNDSSATMTETMSSIGQITTLGSYSDPFAGAVALGQTWMSAAAALMITFTILMPVLGVAISWCDAMLPGEAVTQATQGVLEPLMYAMAAFLYVQGALLGIYLPLIPFIIFLTASLGWLISAIEAMVAAPLVAIGLAWPEAQSEVLGRAEPAVMLILNLFLRPGLMIIGLMMGLLLVMVGMQLANFGYTAMLYIGGMGADLAFGSFPLTLAYIGLVMAVVTKCFNLIHQIPDKVLYWIGDQSQSQGGAEEALGGAKSGTEQGAQGAGGMKVSGGGKAGYKTAKAGHKAYAARKEAAAKNKPTAISGAKSETPSEPAGD